MFNKNKHDQVGSIKLSKRSSIWLFVTCVLSFCVGVGAHYFYDKIYKSNLSQENVVNQQVENKNLAREKVREPQTIADLSSLLDSGLKVEIKGEIKIDQPADSRDAKRLADIKQIQAALELYFNDNFSYPSVGANVVLGEGNYRKLCENGFVDAGVSCKTTYLSVIPANPESEGTKYIYNFKDKEHYEISFMLESETGPFTAGKFIASQMGIEQITTEETPPEEVEALYRFEAPFEILTSEEKWTKDPTAALVSKERFYSIDGGKQWLKDTEQLKTPLFRFFENKSGTRCQVKNQTMEIVYWGTGWARYYKDIQGKSIYILDNDEDFNGLFWCNNSNSMLIMAPIYQNNITEAENRVNQYFNIYK